MILLYHTIILNTFVIYFMFLLNLLSVISLAAAINSHRIFKIEAFKIEAFKIKHEYTLKFTEEIRFK